MTIAAPCRALGGILLGLVVAIGVIQSSEAVVLIDTDFTAADGYNDGALRFQQPNGAGNGIWLGQLNPTSMNPSVDSTAGTVTVGTGFPPAGDAFFRNAWSLGATGGTLGGSSDETGSGFMQGDVIQIDFTYQFDIVDGDANHDLYNIGVTDCFAQCGFDATPQWGLEAGYSEFEDGGIKFFTHPGREATNGGDNPFALIIPAPDLGVDSGFSGNPIDLSSDNFRVSYTAELTDSSTDTWTATELVITNIDTATEVGRATVDNPGALESFVWNSTGVDDIFTDGFENGLAVNPNDAGSELFFAAQWNNDQTPGGSATVSAIRFEYLPIAPPTPDGDYNSDSIVSAADYVVWRDTVGSIGAGLAADGTGSLLDGTPDGSVDDFDRQFWVSNFAAGAPVVAAVASVPEPGSSALLGFVFTMFGARRWKW